MASPVEKLLAVSDRGGGQSVSRPPAGAGSPRREVPRPVEPLEPGSDLTADAEKSATKPKEKRLPQARTIAELVKTTKPQEWGAFGLAAPGCITLLVAREKSGKTTLLLNMLAAVTSNKLWLAHSVIAGPAVILTEEGASTMRAAAVRNGLATSTDLHVLSAREMGGARWPDVAAHALAEVDRLGARYLVVDTINGVAGLERDEEQDSGAADTTMRPLQVGLVKRPQLSILAAKHANKASGGATRPTDMVRGSGQWAGASDHVVGLVAPPKSSRKRILGLLGRLDCPPRLVIELGQNGVYDLARGGADEDLLGEKDDGERARLELIPDTGCTASQYSAPAGLERSQAQQFLSKAHEENLVRREGKGTKGDPYRYFRIEEAEV